MIDLSGRKYGRLTVVKRTGKDRQRRYHWLCRCSCGEEKIVRGDSLKSGKTKSCGCLHKEKVAHLLTKHGHATRMTVSQAYRSWQHIIQRCTNPKHQHYHLYGGRGIMVCERWLNSFENFLVDMGEPPSPTHSIDRIDNNNQYCKSNCQWATKREQSRNRRNNHLETYNGKTQCLASWAEEYNIVYQTLQKRLKLGWSIEKALTTKANGAKPNEQNNTGY
jgi:hypothetical protein